MRIRKKSHKKRMGFFVVVVVFVAFFFHLTIWLIWKRDKSKAKQNNNNNKNREKNLVNYFRFECFGRCEYVRDFSWNHKSFNDFQHVDFYVIFLFHVINIRYYMYAIKCAHMQIALQHFQHNETQNTNDWKNIVS